MKVRTDLQIENAHAKGYCLALVLEEFRRKFDAGPGNVEEGNGSAEEKERRYKKFPPRSA